MRNHLPDRIDPWKLAASGGCLKGRLPLDGMPRLASLVEEVRRTARLELWGRRDEQGLSFLQGRVEAGVILRCQRCLGPMEALLEAEVNLAPVHSEAHAEALPRHYDPLLVGEQMISLGDLVEDELILALPVVPLHQDPGDCEANGYRPTADEPETVKGDNPFAVLSTLLKSSKHQE
ncbi:MAG: YceD family protein [Candidatus Competibacteraceae bacterium]|nr:YceD family protein [Candidatus Competibacteraceae bacterium]